jgi:hypothetical protein
MKRLIFVLLTLSTLVGCQKKHSADDYLTKEKRDSLLVDIITYMYAKPSGANSETMFNLEFRKFYISQLPNFKLEKLFKTTTGKYYFYVIRPALSATANRRGVGGSFYLSEKGKPKFFKEIFNTPVGSVEELQAKGENLFEWIIKHDNVNELMLHQDLIEWPTKWNYYDTLKHEWVVRPGI